MNMKEKEQQQNKSAKKFFLSLNSAADVDCKRQ